MHKEFLTGNEAIALGALAAGVNVATGYPGTPSTEALETVAKRGGDSVYVEWSVNEKAAVEVAAGAALGGARTLVTMKQMGLNVASDPIMSLEYLGVKGGMVIMVADDPGPISSQTEQDTRVFAGFSKLPLFDPSSVREAYEITVEAFEYSEKYKTPVFLRPTTRICHGCAAIDVLDKDEYYVNKPEGFVRDPSKWVIFPKLSYENHIKIVDRNVKIADDFSSYKRNFIIPAQGKKGVAAHGISYAYARDALKNVSVPILKITTPYPFPEKLALKFLKGLDEVLCVEELDPAIERELIYVCGKYGLKTRIYGKLSGDVKKAGENSVESVYESLSEFLGLKKRKTVSFEDAPVLPTRPPTLCAGCPHRASFYAVKKAVEGRERVFCGDIGCYTLGNAEPLNMADSCLCMGAGINMARGIGLTNPDAVRFAFVGDSTFFASGITGAVNAFYNGANITLVVLDNFTTAMTGRQPHPGTGVTASGKKVKEVNAEKILKAIGLETVETVDPFELKKAIKVVRETASKPGVKAIIFKSPCAALTRPSGKCEIDPQKCRNCEICIKEIGCPAIIKGKNGVEIDPALCVGCGLCSEVCPFGAVKGGGGK